MARVARPSSSSPLPYSVFIVIALTIVITAALLTFSLRSRGSCSTSRSREDYERFNGDVVSHPTSLVPSPVADIVIARYSESLDWFCDPEIVAKVKDSGARVIVYDKNPARPLSDAFEACYQGLYTRVELPNVGRDVHTYLWHIVQNYESLAPVTVFVVGSCHLPNKNARCKATILRAVETRDSVFLGAGPPHEGMYDFVLDEYLPSDSANRTQNPDPVLEPSAVRPFGAWLERSLNMKYGELKYVTWNCMFAVHERHIRQRPRSYYESLLGEVSRHHAPEVGHYMERAWAHVFGELPESAFPSSF